MIWNPWKEIAKLREDARRTAVFRQYDGAFVDQQRAKITELREQLDLHVNMAIEEGRKAAFLQSDKEVLQKRNEALIRTLESHEDDLAEMSKVLQDIAAEDKPTSSAVVKRICKMAREGLKQ
jgi:hypothetical protein